MLKKPMLFFSFICLSLMVLSQDLENEIRKSAITFIDSLTTLQKKRALLDFSDTVRVRWNNLPVGLRARADVNIGSMSEEQRKLVHRMLSASLSSQGYLKSTSIMHLDNLLNMYVDTMRQRQAISDTLYQRLKDLKWSHQNYYVLNGPTFLIEFDNNGGPRRAANHIHAIWREKGNEYGEDLLKKHYETEHKQQSP